MKGSSIQHTFEIGDKVSTRAHLPSGPQNFIAPGTLGTVREKDPSSGSYLVEFETGERVRANGDLIIPA